MQKLIILTLVAVTAVLATTTTDDEHYKSRLDSINLDEVLKNNRLVDNYIKCALEKARCTPDGQEIKQQFFDLLPEILDTNCGKCTEDQKEKIRRVLHFMHEKKPAAFNEILNKHDPDMKLRNQYKEKYQDVAKEEGFADIFE